MKNNNDTMYGYAWFIIILNICGFLSWVLYQVVAKEVEFFNSISLLAGLSFWWLYLMISLTPRILSHLYQTALMRVVDQQRQTELAKSLDLIAKNNQDKIEKSFNNSKDEFNKFKH